MGQIREIGQGHRGGHSEVSLLMEEKQALSFLSSDRVTPPLTSSPHITSQPDFFRKEGASQGGAEYRPYPLTTPRTSLRGAGAQLCIAGGALRHLGRIAEPWQLQFCWLPCQQGGGRSSGGEFPEAP